MTTVVLVDWLGRGGIAQCTEAWSIELRRHGLEVATVTRGGRELKGDGVIGVEGAGRVRAHLAVADRAARVIDDVRPDLVVVQNWVLPVVERRVHAAARRVGARHVVVIHDHRMHSRVAGVRAGLRSTLRRADAVVAHTHFVADAVHRYAGRAVDVVPHPVQVGMLDYPRPVQPLLPVAGRLGLHFGVVKRGYKGTDLVVDLADAPPDGWHFAIVGVGAPAPRPNLASIDRFLDPGELCSVVAESQVTLLPYRFATQSGAVVLAQACGSIPIATAVGGIPEQIEDGRTGRLVSPDAGRDVWRQLLVDLADAAFRAELAANAERAVWDQHERFVKCALDFAA